MPLSKFSIDRINYIIVTHTNLYKLFLSWRKMSIGKYLGSVARVLGVAGILATNYSSNSYAQSPVNPPEVFYDSLRTARESARQDSTRRAQIQTAQIRRDSLRRDSLANIAY